MVIPLKIHLRSHANTIEIYREAVHMAHKTGCIFLARKQLSHFTDRYIHTYNESSWCLDRP